MDAWWMKSLLLGWQRQSGYLMDSRTAWISTLLWIRHRRSEVISIIRKKSTLSTLIQIDFRDQIVQKGFSS